MAGGANAYLFLLLLMSFILSKFQGDGDSALDRLWQKKKVEVQQEDGFFVHSSGLILPDKDFEFTFP